MNESVTSTEWESAVASKPSSSMIGELSEAGCGDGKVSRQSTLGAFDAELAQA